MNKIRYIAAPASFFFVPDPTNVGTGSVYATKRKIDSFKNLPSGWHYGEGMAPDQAKIDLAHDWHRKLAELGFQSTDASPGVGGEIMISGYHESDDVEIVLEGDESISFYHEHNDEIVTSISHEAPGAVDEALERAGAMIWNTSGSSTKEILRLRKIDSIAWRSEIITAAHPLFSEHVLRTKAPRYVLTYGSFTQMPPANHPYFGYSMKRQSRQAAD